MPVTTDQRGALAYFVTRVFVEDKRILKWATWNQMRIASTLQSFGLKKPFWQKLDDFFVQTLLNSPELFKKLALNIELAACVAGEDFYWNGCGQRRGFNTASQFTYFSFVPGDECLITIDVTAIYARLIDLLALPQRPRSSRKEKLTPEAATLLHETGIKKDIELFGEHSTGATQAARIQEMIFDLTDASVQSLNAIAKYRSTVDTSGIESDPPSGGHL
jgi:hypothetical protein